MAREDMKEKQAKFAEIHSCIMTISWTTQSRNNHSIDRIVSFFPGYCFKGCGRRFADRGHYRHCNGICQECRISVNINILDDLTHCRKFQMVTLCIRCNTLLMQKYAQSPFHNYGAPAACLCIK